MWNQALNDVRRYEEIYDAAKTGFLGSSNDATRLENFIAEVFDDPARKAAFLNLIGQGTESSDDPEDLVSGKTEPFIELRDEFLNRFPPE